MAVATIYWGDGTSDVITVTYTGSVGSSQMVVASSPNKSVNERSKTIKLKTAGGMLMGTLSVTQNSRSRAYKAAYSPAYK